MFKKILVPLDGSKLAEKILPQVEKLAKCHKAKVTLITIGGYGMVETVGEATPAIIEEASKHVKEEAEEYLAGISTALKKKGVPANWVYREGMPARGIIAYAADHKMDLIALASHGRGEVAWVLGSVAEKVISHATVPVLLVRVIEFKPPLLKEEFFMGA
jgi:nucleotide-binding universal stress UspA family protein